MTDTDVRRMTVAEIALMREIVTWRRVNSYAYVPRMWYSGGPEAPGVAWDFAAGQVGVTPRLDLVQLQWHDVDSLTQAVDVLTALGYLPARFSSAYRAGWEAATIWETAPDSGPRYDEFKRLFHDPENVSFPAGLD